MATVKGKETVVLVAGTDISRYCDSSDHKPKADIEDITTYGKDWHVKEGTLLDGSGSLGGLYDSDAVAGPAAVLEPLLGQTVTYTRRVRGTGSGKPQMVRDVVVGEYTETAPVAGMVRWTCALEYSDEPDNTPQA